MLIPLNWLKEYVETNLTDQQIADKLTFAGLQIEDIKNGVMDGEVTANRPDWLSIYGVAREFAALTGSSLKDFIKPSLNIGEKTIISVQTDPTLISRYSGYVIQNIRVGESPDWLKKKLAAVGIRSINNIVDITNFIMIETGQPLHAFDADKISGPIIIRRGRSGETVATLDQIKRKVNENIIVAENDGRLIDLVGIMGGALSDTSSATKNIFLQAAVFPPTLIRKSSKTAKLSTEASYRYERGVDYIKTNDYLDRAAALALELCGGEIVQAIDINPDKPAPTPINWTLDQVKSLLGVEISADQALTWLNALGIKTVRSDNHFTSASPSWRFDINLKEDIIEEIARFYPVNDMPRTILPPIKIETKQSEYHLIEYIKDQLINLGLTEIDGYSFLSAKNLLDANLNPRDCLEASNPLSEEYQYLRPQLLPDMLLAVAQNPSFSPIAFFEIGHVFTQNNEENHLGIILAGTPAEVQKLSSSIEGLTKTLKRATISTVILNKFKIRKSTVVYWEIPFEELKNTFPAKNIQFEIPKMDQHYQSVSKFPSVTRDLAIIVDKDLKAADIESLINSVKPEIETSTTARATLFDEFVSDRFGQNKKSLAFHIDYQSTEKTLTSEQVEKIHGQIITALKNKYQAVPRI